MFGFHFELAIQILMLWNSITLKMKLDLMAIFCHPQNLFKKTNQLNN